MNAALNPYLSFRDTAREAMTFYQSVLGGELDITSFEQLSMPNIPPEAAGLVMHSMLITPGAGTLMGADTPPGMETSPNGTVALFGDDEATLRGWWDGLSDGATVGLPLNKAPWGDHFGQLTDRFGVSWMVNISGGPA